MAIINNIETIIKIDGEALREYKVSPDNDPYQLDKNREPRPFNAAEARNYIEVQDGAHFTIVYRLLPGYDYGKGNAICFNLHIDGRELSPTLVIKLQSEHKAGREQEVKGHTYGDGTNRYLQKFRFGGLLGNETLSRETGNEWDFGEICVTAWLEEGSEITDISQPHQVESLDEASGKTVKGNGVELGTQYGEAEKIKKPPMWQCYQLEDKPRATFVFYYRSTKILRILGVIGVNPPLRERPIKSLNIKQARHLLREYMAQQDSQSSAITEEMAKRVSEHLLQLERAQSQEQETDESDVEEIPCPNQFKHETIAFSYDEIL